MSRLFPARLALACLTVLAALSAAPALAATRPQAPVASDPESAKCVAAVQRAEQRHGIPHGLLMTMAKVESGRPTGPGGSLAPWPWTVDADGTGMFFASKDAAVAWMKQADGQRAHFIDVGCLQVNLQMHPDAFASLDQAFDPAANVEYAARFLARLRAQAGGNWYTAVGLYHSATPFLAESYRQMVIDVAAGRAPSGGFVPLYLRALRRGAVLLTVAGGHVTVINTARQPAARWHKRPSVCRIAAVLGSYLRAPPRGCAHRR